jgi:hypothetical protein
MTHMNDLLNAKMAVDGITAEIGRHREIKRNKPSPSIHSWVTVSCSLNQMLSKSF